ncbi:hypothetical protein [Bradyrhizobium sp. BR 1432]|uniref:hypothetical protein n=1 Tax=Bradyrhizobium sp. BR 1432 TaxID=3447966 RepID=UPI003EE5E41E
MESINERRESAATPDKPPSILDQHEGVDWLLAWIINLAEQGCATSITVAAEGQLVTGTVIGGHEYFRTMAANMKNANVAGQNGQELREVLSNGMDGFRQLYPGPGDLNDMFGSKPGYLHMKDTKFVVGNSLTGSGALWRIKLASISGFTLSTVQRT